MRTYRVLILATEAQLAIDTSKWFQYVRQVTASYQLAPAEMNAGELQKLQEFISSNHIYAVYPIDLPTALQTKPYEFQLKCRVVAHPNQTWKKWEQHQTHFVLDGGLFDHTNEFTVDCFSAFNKPTPHLLIRELQRGTWTARPEWTERIETIAVQLQSLFHFKGCWTIRFIRTTGEWHYEVFPFADQMAYFWIGHGINLHLMNVLNNLGIPLDFEETNSSGGLCTTNHQQPELQLDFSPHTIYFDFDCCLVNNGEINTDAITLIKQSKSKGKRIELISRHRGNLKSYLQSLHIDSLFDDVHHLTRNEPKSGFIKPDSIFFDDAYRERKEVCKQCGIPTFGPEAIPLFLENTL